MNIQIDALLRGAPGQEQSAVIEARLFPSSQRIVRAFAGFVACWLMALLTFFVPVLHFFLVPLFLLGGPITAYLLGSKKGVIQTQEVPCPACGAGLPIQGRNFRFPFYLSCSQCSQRIFVESEKSN